MPSSGYAAISFTAGEQPTTAKWNLVGSNDASFNTGNGFNDAILATRHFGTNSVPALALDTAAITLGYAQSVADFSTASGTAVQLTGLTTTVTIPAGGRKVRITGFVSAPYNDTNNGGIQITIWDGTVGSGTQLNGALHEKVTPISAHSVLAMAIVTPAAGSKTYNIGINQAGGVGNVHTQASATSPAFILVEVI